MMSTTFDQIHERVASGEPLTAHELQELAAAPDVLRPGMLADAVKRRLHGDRTTYLRVAVHPYDAPWSVAAPPAAREICLTGAPGSVGEAAAAVAAARAAAGDRTVRAFAWADVERLADGDAGLAGVLTALRDAGLDAIHELPLDTVGDPDRMIQSLVHAGFGAIRLSNAGQAGAASLALWERAAALQQRHGCIQTIAPLAFSLRAFRPTTGYQDVKAVALARLAASNVPSIQVDWMRYGPKLAQVALTFGADDVWGISPSDDAPEGRRRAPLEEIRRNIEAAGFVPVERDGRFAAAS